MNISEDIVSDVITAYDAVLKELKDKNQSISKTCHSAICEMVMEKLP